MRKLFALAAWAVLLQTRAVAGEYQYIIDPGPERTGGFEAPSACVALSTASRSISRSAADALSAKFRTFYASVGCNLNSNPARGAVLIIR